MFAPDRPTQRKAGIQHEDPVAAATSIIGGSMVMLDASGDAQPAVTTTTLRVRGVATEAADNELGAAGDISVKTERGAAWRFENSAGADEITRADIEADCFVVDFQTVAKTNGTNTRVVAGVIDDVDADGVWVRI